jgi:Flp pilus assembly protein TadD
MERKCSCKKDQAMRVWKSANLRPLPLFFYLVGTLGLASCGTVATRTSDDAAGRAKITQQAARDQFGPALRLARASRANGDLASAINLYSSIVAIKPADPAVMLEFGDTLVDAGSLDDAIEVYRKVEPGSVAWLGAQLGLQQAYLRLGEPEKSLLSVDQAIIVSPGDHRLLVCRGVTLDMLGQHVQAQESYRAVLAKAPGDVAARNDLALSLALAGQFGEAEDIMASMVRSSTATPRLRQNLALIYGLAGDAAHAGALSRMDLDTNTTYENMRFFELARSEQEH